MPCEHGLPAPSACLDCLNGPPPQPSFRYRYSRPHGSRVLMVHEDSCRHCDTGFGHRVSEYRTATMTWVPDESVAEGMRAAQVMPTILGAEGASLEFDLCAVCLRDARPAAGELTGAMAAFERDYLVAVELPVA